jgi:hypothetical protein
VPFVGLDVPRDFSSDAKIRTLSHPSAAVRVAATAFRKKKSLLRTGRPGTEVTILKMFSPKKNNKAVLHMQNFDLNIGF